MDLIDNLALGFSTALTFANIAYAFAGVLIGTLIGVLPGIGPIATLAMLLPMTYALEPTSALIMLAGIYYGAQYGGSTTAILVNLPGESSSVVTCIDGYQMARRGRAGAALATAALGSFFAGTVGTLILAALALPMVELAFKFGPAEYFSLMALGLIGAVVLASGSLVKAIAMIVLGLLLGLVGTDVNSGVARFNFDVPELADGIGFVAVAMGVFGFAEIIANLEHKGQRQVFTDKVGKLLPTMAEFKEAVPAVLRGTALGSVLGVLPGGGALLAAFAAYTVEKKVTRNPKIPFGQGNIRGVAAPVAQGTPSLPRYAELDEGPVDIMIHATDTGRLDALHGQEMMTGHGRVPRRLSVGTHSKTNARGLGHALLRRLARSVPHPGLHQQLVHRFLSPSPRPPPPGGFAPGTPRSAGATPGAPLRAAPPGPKVQGHTSRRSDDATGSTASYCSAEREPRRIGTDPVHLHACRLCTLFCLRQHFRGQVQARDRIAPLRQLDRVASCPATDIEYRTARL